MSDLKPIPIPCWSWQVTRLTDQHSQDTVNLMRSVGVGAWTATREIVDAAVALCLKANEAFPDARPATISVGLSPDHHNWLEENPQNLMSMAENLIEYEVKFSDLRNMIAGRVSVSARSE